MQLNLNSTPAANLVYYQSGDTLKSSIQPSLEETINAELLPLKNKTEQLIGSVEAIIVSINAFWDTSAAYTIDESLYEVRDAIGTFGDLANNMSILISKETDRVDRILTDVNSISTNLASKKDQINGTIDNITAITDTIKNSGLKSVINETTNTLSELNLVLQKINEGQGSLGLLMKTDSLHNELVRTNQSVQSLLEDMEANPNKYVHFSVFGRKPN
jgi:phospholipid/cholesterol/gamma-HCH transport system substrate-binding protein